MKILIATDAWQPQMNGVVRTLNSTVSGLERMGHEVFVMHPAFFYTIPLPTYPEIKLALLQRKKIKTIIEKFDPDSIHVATEGTIGLGVRNYCVRHGFQFTSSYTTKFPEYIYKRFRIPEKYSYRLIRWFHEKSSGVMVATDRLRLELEKRGFTNIVMWTRGVDTQLFNPSRPKVINENKPVLLYAGRLAIEKNIEAFLDLDIPGVKYVVGTGPDMEMLKRKYPDVNFVGRKSGEELASWYASADVFVFPSKTDTFGLVMLEALASGVPVAAYPVTGPVDVITSPEVGVLDNDLAEAVKKALGLKRENCRQFALGFSWDRVARIFINNLVPKIRQRL